jgi:hypothetical protein
MKRSLLCLPLIVFIIGLTVSTNINAQIPPEPYPIKIPIGGKTLYSDAKTIKISKSGSIIGETSELERTELEQALRKLILEAAQTQTMPISNQRLSQAVKEIIDDMIKRGIRLFPIISISRDVRDERNARIDTMKAPFIVRVKGTVSYARRFYVYLVVNDDHAEWIEPTTGLGANVNGDFSGKCYLGVKDDRNSLDKWYKVSAVVTNREYEEYEKLDRKTLIVQTTTIELFRTR